MRDRDQADNVAEQRLVEDAGPACTALVPVVRTAQWSNSRSPPCPNAMFITQLIATVEHAPQTRGLRRTAASDATAAYAANRNRALGMDLRERRIV